MENTLFLLIHGKPIAKKRPRFARHGRFVRTYGDQETEEGRFLFEVKQQIGHHECFQGALSMAVNFYMPIPKSTSKKRKGMMIDGDIHHTKKPDVDNCIKFVCDCLNNLVWRDDSQVFQKIGTKRYSENPRTEITIWQVAEL